MSDHHRTPGWQRFTAMARPIIRASLPAACVQPRCQMGGIVEPDQKWDVAHIVAPDEGGTDTLDNIGPAHQRCNRSDGGRVGQAKQMAAKVERARLPRW
jgi:hypothetical protein